MKKKMVEVALITGASSGLGAGISKVLASKVSSEAIRKEEGPLSVTEKKKDWSWSILVVGLYGSLHFEYMFWQHFQRKLSTVQIQTFKNKYI